jgi:hypothetical protein
MMIDCTEVSAKSNPNQNDTLIVTLHIATVWFTQMTVMRFSHGFAWLQQPYSCGVRSVNIEVVKPSMF